MSKFLRGCAFALAAVLTGSPAIAGDEAPGYVSEVRVGVLAHDQGIFSSHKEDGIDINGEVLFMDLGWLGDKIALRPHIGGSVNTTGDTSQAYAGLTATIPVFSWGFFDFSFGGAYHNGETDSGRVDKKDLGCHALFRESASLGAYIGDHHTISAFADHISNASICSKNEGLENVGVRYGYRF